jgi:hypothetical protein
MRGRMALILGLLGLAYHEAAKAEFQASWRQWLDWEKLGELE